MFFGNSNQVHREHRERAATSFRPLPARRVTTERARGGTRGRVVGRPPPCRALSPLSCGGSSRYTEHIGVSSPYHLSTLPHVRGRSWMALVARAAKGWRGERGRRLNDRTDGRRELGGSVGKTRRAGGCACASSERAGATPDRRRPSHTILRTIPPPRQSSVRIRTVDNP